MSIQIGLKLKQVDALWDKAQEALIPQSEFFAILNQEGATTLLHEFAQRGVISSSKPAQSEIKFELMATQAYETNNSLFFTFRHGSLPLVDMTKWKLTVEGNGVDYPVSFNYDDILKLPLTTVTRYLECADNGRAFYDLLLNQKAEGPQWHFGGYGIAEWTGVKLSDILRQAKFKNNTTDVMPVGMDSPHYERPMPVEKAMEEDSILAYIMNGKILPLDHGFPLRAIVPGWAGAASVKWIHRIIVSTKPLQVPNNTDRYVLIGPDYLSLPPAKGPVVTNQVVKSACCLPWPAVLKRGHQHITGYAWSPFGKIAKVEVSLDDGKTFQQAALVGPNIERSGTRWEFHLDANPGKLTIMPKATDDKGITQHDLTQQKWNKLGYLFGAMVPHPVTVSEDFCILKTQADNSTMPIAPGCC